MSTFHLGNFFIQAFISVFQLLNVSLGLYTVYSLYSGVMQYTVYSLNSGVMVNMLTRWVQSVQSAHEVTASKGPVVEQTVQLARRDLASRDQPNNTCARAIPTHRCHQYGPLCCVSRLCRPNGPPVSRLGPPDCGSPCCLGPPDCVSPCCQRPPGLAAPTAVAGPPRRSRGDAWRAGCNRKGNSD